jgi:phosphoglucosamine mutase
MPKYPQTMINVRIAGKPDINSPELQASIKDVERQLGDNGRVVLRASGTEPVIRVMVEGEDAAQVALLASQLATIVGAVAT